MLEDIDTKEKVAYSSYKEMEQLDIQILLTDNYYVNPNNIPLCFPMKIKNSLMKQATLRKRDNSKYFFCSFDKRSRCH